MSEKNSHQEYRDNLAEEVLSEPDNERRREILRVAKETELYKKAEFWKREKSDLSRKEMAEIKKLDEYGKKNFENYIAIDRENGEIHDPVTKELSDTIRKNSRIFGETILPNAPDKFLNDAYRLLSGERPEDVVSLLQRFNFDFERILNTEGDEQSKAILLITAMLKAESYDATVKENQDKPILFEGFDGDPDMEGVEDFLQRSFGVDLLQKCLISKIKYSQNELIVDLNETEYLLPVESYKEWEREMPEVEKRKFIASSMVYWNLDDAISDGFVPTMIRIYNFYGEDPEELDYLKSVPDKDKMRLYKLGTIAHEVGHHIYGYLMDANKRTEWEKLVNSGKAMTEYADLYVEHRFKYDEFFSEAIRLKTTVPEYFKSNFPEIDRFLTENFFSVKSK